MPLLLSSYMSKDELKSRGLLFEDISAATAVAAHRVVRSFAR